MFFLHFTVILTYIKKNGGGYKIYRELFGNMDYFYMRSGGRHFRGSREGCQPREASAEDLWMFS